MTKLRVLDLFSGIGGFSLGLERTGGFETVAFCEIEPFPRKVLAKHWPNVPVYEDVRTLTAERLAADGVGVDVICGGFPCQDVSVAGERSGLGGERSGLWFEYARIIGELRPRLVLVENVPGLLSLGMGRVLGDLAEIGYDAEWQSIPVAAVGLPHTRDRVWIVAYPREERAEGSRPATFPWLAGVPWGENVRRAAVIAKRPDLLAPTLCRGGDGIPDRVDRTGACGNAVSPLITELIGRAILAAEAA